MIQVEIEARGCRGCAMCVDICPVQVFERDDALQQATVQRSEDCIGCLSCRYACPSGCVSVNGAEELRPFHRIEAHVALVERFLQAKTATGTLAQEDFDEAWQDVSGRLNALAGAIIEVFGTGYASIGRRAGSLAAIHLPEIHGEDGLDVVLNRMQKQFAQAFRFDYALKGDDVQLTFQPCGLCQIVEDAGQKVGDAVLCKLFHEYWTGLLSEFVGKSYAWKLPQAGRTCVMELSVRA
jgi:Fe-S-cluster-containing hydrogenase component 2